MTQTIIDIHLPVNPRSRPGRPLMSVRAIPIHWIASAGSNPFDVFRWWHPAVSRRYASAALCVANEGYAIGYMEIDELTYNCGDEDPDGAGPLMAYTDWATAVFGGRGTSNAWSDKYGWTGSSPNYYTTGIELCHIDGEGHFTSECLETAARLAAHVCQRSVLNPLEYVTTHKNIVGEKNCPALWAAEPWRLDMFRQRVYDVMAAGSVVIRHVDFDAATVAGLIPESHARQHREFIASLSAA